jgi:hypothetical protein
MYTSLLSALSVGYGTTTTSDHVTKRHDSLQRHYRKVCLVCLLFLREVVTVCKLWVVVIGRESLVSFERNSISSYFDKLLEGNTVSWYYSAVPSSTGDSSKRRSAHSEGNVSIGMQICIVFICFRACYTYQSDLSRKSWELMVCGELVEVAGYTNAQLNTILLHGDANLYIVGLLFLECNSVQSGSLLRTFWK